MKPNRSTGEGEVLQVTLSKLYVAISYKIYSEKIRRELSCNYSFCDVSFELTRCYALLKTPDLDN